MKIYIEVLKKYAVFSGRARRQEFWIFFLVNTIILIPLMILDFTLGTYPLFFGLYSLATLLPNLGLTVRRLHDTGKSGWFILLTFIPFVGFIIGLVFMATEGQPQANEYGPSPKAVQAY
ncbi:DUF805 domain-containing protein [Streptomyces venezuelae]|uniref:DUF805 domain-containing protein n=1 Tax=Streptomyces venezuelae TaxID=54571 RepID=A0A5P2CXP5_STRVZ|nr:DUF805 domain-containing protein [Streptomyces venezuelae]QES47223.1 DUF805 domain-containing protein [Streptomyces venezuelae]